MNQSYLFRMFVGIITTSICTALQAQNFSLIDINKIKNSFPSNYQFSSMDEYAELNGVFYFTADDGIHGVELWRSDATAEGTKLFKDITPGLASSYPVDIITGGNKIYFITNSNSSFVQLWVSDGTYEGTQVVTSLDASIAASGNFQYLTDVNGIVYFNEWYYDTNYYNFYNQLWKTDGTVAGTEMVVDLNTEAFGYGGGMQNLLDVNGRLFFTMYTAYYGPSLCTSDGTAAGSSTLLTGYSVGHMTGVNGSLYFSADDGTGGRLWVSDGTVPGTHSLKNRNNVFVPSDSRPFAVKNSVLFFEGGTDLLGYELYKYNTADPNANLNLVKDINPGTNSSYPGFITNVNNTLFFTAWGNNGDQELWKSDGTPDGTRLVKDINPGGFNYYYGLINVKGTLMFAYYNDDLGFELWKSNGTGAGTVIVKDISPGIYSSFPGYFTFRKGIFLFSANDGHAGFELWTSDGTDPGTFMVKNINRTSTSSSYPSGITETSDGRTVLNAQDEKYGNELWKTDGTDPGTKIAKDIYEGSFGSYPYLFTNFKHKTYFLAADASGYYLGKTDGTKSGTTLFYQIPPDAPYYIENLVATDNLLYFTIINFTSSLQELWRSDGTAPGTYALRKDLTGYYYLWPTAVGKTLFFVNDDGVNGLELWKTNGTTAGTGLVKDVYPGAYSSYPSSLYNFNGRLYFTAYGDYGNFFWTSDGTDDGTEVIKAIDVGSFFARAKGKLFFSGLSTIAKGYELYASDGTAAGTYLVKDIYKGPAYSNAFNLVSGDTLLYFMADNGKRGSELWRSNGTKEGTYLVKDITKGIYGSYFPYMVNVDDRLFFVMNDTLWQSDGSRQGTHKIKDETIDGVRGINGLAAAHGKIYFYGYTYATGQELYAADIASPFVSSQPVASNSSGSPRTNVFAAQLLTNPVKDVLKFTVSVKGEQYTQIVISDVAGRTLVSDKKILSSGINIFTYNANGWARGIYLIRIATADGSSSLLKAAK